MTRFTDVGGAQVIALHDARIAGDPRQPTQAPDVLTWIEQNHECNTLLWHEEDLARRTTVPDAEIVANKRAIDRYNQQRNDAVERIDEALLARLHDVVASPRAWHNSETAGAIIDRLSILALKLFHMGKEAMRGDAAHRERCADRHARLQLQRNDLARCYDTLLAHAEEGRAFWRIYRQFKMYNDPTLNPYLQSRAVER